MSKVLLTVTESKCRCGYVKTGDTFVVDDLCPPLCHELWTTIYPSVYALKNGASLDYGTEKAKCFDAMCPDECRVHIHGEVMEDDAVPEGTHANDVHDRINAYENFITDMVRYASSQENPEKIINQLVQYIGEELDSDRAYIFEDNHDGTFRNTYEWCKEGVSSEIDNLQEVPYEGIIEVWYKQYEKSHNIIIYDLEDYKKVSESVYNILKPQGINTLVTGPIIIKGKMVGFYGVDNPPKNLLHIISELIGMMEFLISFMIRIRDNSHNLEFIATHDQLTNCRNRTALNWLYNIKADSNMSLAVLMCDLNGLKKVNDKQGHDAGDKFILRSAEILKSIFGDENVYRMGGDEFVALLTNTSETDFEEKVNLTRIQMGTTASIGTVYKKSMDTDFDSILKIADTEMYKQKKKYYKTIR